MKPTYLEPGSRINVIVNDINIGYYMVPKAYMAKYGHPSRWYWLKLRIKIWFLNILNRFRKEEDYD